MSEPLHPTCLETTSHAALAAGERTYICGQNCPRPADPDAARDARVAKRRAEDARAASRGLDRLLYDQGFEDGIRYAEVRRMFADLPRHEPVHGPLCQCSVCAPELYKSGE